MRALLFSLVLLFVGVSQSTAITREHCLPAQEVTRLLSELNFVGADRWSTDEVCNPEKLTYKTIQALIFIRNLELSEGAHSQLYPNLLGKNPWSFFSSRIREIQFAKNCQAGVLAYVNLSQKNTAHICQALVHSEVSSFAATLLHEARHVDGFSHVMCSHGDLVGTAGGCDLKLEEAGSYGLEIEWGLKLAKSDKVSKIVRDQSRSSSVYLLLNRINEFPLGIKEGLALQALNGEITFFDGNNQALITSAASPDSVLSDRLGTPVFFDARANSALGYYFSTELLSVPGFFAQYLTSNLSPSDKEALLDINYDKLLFLFKDKILFVNDSGQFVEARHGISQPLLFSVIRSLPPLKAGVYITAADGSIFRLPENLNDLNKKQPEFISKPQNQLIKIVQGINGSNYALSMDGSLTTLSDRWGYTPVPVEALHGQAFKNITPTLWSPLLEGL